MDEDYDSDSFHGEHPYYSRSARQSGSRQPSYQGYDEQAYPDGYYSSTPRSAQYPAQYPAHQDSPSTWDSSSQAPDYNYTHTSGLPSHAYSQSQSWPNQEDDGPYYPRTGRSNSNTYHMDAAYPTQLTAPQASYGRGSVHPPPGNPVYLSSQNILDPRYVTQATSFYSVGKVFSVLWHENDGRGTGTVASRGPQFIGRFGEPIYSTIRRMVVVRKLSQCSWCIAINTYGGQGVAKPGIDEAQHAIVYMRGASPIASEDERPMVKEPLEISPDRQGERLDPMSRLNFGKIYTVEHNVKVLPIGKVATRSMARFRQYAAEEFVLE